MDLTAEQLQALQKVIGSAAVRIASRLNIGVDRLERFLDDVSMLVIDSQGIVHNSYTLVACFDKQGNANLTAGQIVSNSASDMNQFFVDEALNVVSISSASVDPVSVSDRSLTSSNLEILIESTGVTSAYLCGRLESQLELCSFGAVSNPHEWSRPISDFAKILADHVQHAVANEQQFRYWANKQKRILLSGPKGTENLFQHKLYWWLKTYVSDAIKVVAEAQGFGQDKTDVTIVTGRGSIVIEIKWLGKNDKKTEWKHPPRIDEGLEQVRLYLEKDTKLIKGYVVVYDARPSSLHESLKTHDKQFQHPSCEDPYVIFLDSESPSNSAKTNVASSSATKQKKPKLPAN